jgi:hypothetical protein
MTLEFSRQIFEKYSNIKFHKIRPMKAELFHADRWKDGRTDRPTDGQTDMTKLVVAFRKFENAAKN